VRKKSVEIYRELAPDSAGCVKCDNGLEMITDQHHRDGSVCSVVARNYSFSDVVKVAPLGRYNPGKDQYLGNL
jgi:hypothetical protein